MFHRSFLLLALTTLASFAERESPETRRYYVSNTNSIKVNGRSENIPQRGAERLTDGGYQKAGMYRIVITRPRPTSQDLYFDLTKYNPGGVERGTHRITYNAMDDDQPHFAKEYCDGASSQGLRVYRPYDMKTSTRHMNGDASPFRTNMARPYVIVRRETLGQGDQSDRLLPYPFSENVEGSYDESFENDDFQTYSERPFSIWKNYLENENEDGRSMYGASLRTDNFNVNSNTNVIRNRRNVLDVGDNALSPSNGAAEDPLPDNNENEDDPVIEKYDE